MAELNQFLVDNLVVVLAALLALILLLLLIALVQSMRLGRAVRSYRALVSDGGQGSLGEVLEAHMGRVTEVRERLGELDRQHAELARRSETSIQHIGLVRFNPFEDTGSDQSFAIALLDERRDGIVISSLHGRTNTRVFAKPVSGGNSSHALSDEEAQAIRIAVSGTGANGA
jgi:hypothetical protein